MHKILRRASFTALVAVLAGALGCAAALRPTPTTFTPTKSARTITIEKDVEVMPAWGYKRTLKAGSVWKEVGTVPEGTVYKIEDDVFQLEAAHMHEAYSVVSGNTLVGFFLPVEQAFVTVNEKVRLHLKPQAK